MSSFVFYDGKLIITIRALNYNEAQSILYHNHYTSFINIFGSD